jgi:diguanylate cyclase
VAAPVATFPSRGDLTVATTGALSLLSTTWFVLNLHTPAGPTHFGWLPGPLALALSTVTFWRLGSAPELAPAGRRFWKHLGLATGLVGLGAGIRTTAIFTGLAHSAKPGDSPLISLAFFLVGMLVLLGALLQLPIGARSRAQWLHLALDGATVMAAAVLFIWYFAMAPLLTSSSGASSVWGMLFVAVFAQLALAALVKVLLAGTGPVDAGAMRVLSLALLIGVLSTGLSSWLGDHPHLAAAQLVTAPIGFVAACAAARQRRAVRVRGAASGVGRPWRRPYSLLPYLALVATDTLLVFATIVHLDGRTPVVVGGAIVVTSLVAVRQLAAFIDNARLLRSLRQHEDRLHHQASHDSLTHLANRTLFGDRLEAALRRHTGAAVLLIDLDDFKIVNDTLGHTVGDGLLVAVAERLTSCVRSGDTVARLGGDEFAVLLAGTAPQTTVEVTERLLASLTNPFAACGHSLMVQASIGVAEAEPGDDPERLLRNADIALYAAKEHGKGRHAHYTPAMHAELLEQAQIGAQLHSALDADELELLYQPIVALPGGRICGVEALVRWQHPSRGPLSPAQFVPVAERTGLVVPLGRWVLERACRQLVAWQLAEPATPPAGRAMPMAGRTMPLAEPVTPPITMSVNVSARQLQEATFAAEVAAIVADLGLAPARLTIEVTENAVMRGGQILRTLRELHELGVNLALDDFGTGHSSLGLLRTCPVDILKLDKSFVDEITDSTPRPAVATAIIQMAQALDLATVAEGIETAGQAAGLWQLGYQLGQGFYFARPLPADDVAHLLAGVGWASVRAGG